MEAKRLTETAFRATFTARMREIPPCGATSPDLVPYLDALFPEDLDGLSIPTREVRHVWRDAHDRYDHVLLPLSRANTYLVVVVDLRNWCVHGHHVLDLHGR